MKDFLNQEFAAGHVWRLRAPAGTRFDMSPYGGGQSMLAGPGVVSSNPDWERLKREMAGKTPVSAPLAFGQNAAFGTPAPPVQRTPASALATRRYTPRLQ